MEKLEDPLELLAARWHRILTLDQLRALGLSRRAIEHRVRTGFLRPQHRGVYAVGQAELSRQGRWLAAVRAMGPGAALSHLAAAVLWALIREVDGPVDVSVPRRVRSRPGIRVHVTTTLRREDIVIRNGIPTTNPSRTLLDLADVLPPRQLRRAVGEAEVQRLVNSRTLLDQVARATGRTGAAHLQALVAQGPTPTRSELEDRLIDLIRTSGIHGAITNATVEGFEVDVYFPAERIVVEADGAQFHDTPLARRADAAKQAALEAAGCQVIRVRWDDVTVDRARTIERVRRAKAARYAGSTTHAGPSGPGS